MSLFKSSVLNKIINALEPGTEKTLAIMLFSLLDGGAPSLDVHYFITNEYEIGVKPEDSADTRTYEEEE